MQCELRQFSLSGLDQVQGPDLVLGARPDLSSFVFLIPQVCGYMQQLVSMTEYNGRQAASDLGFHLERRRVGET